MIKNNYLTAKIIDIEKETPRVKNFMLDINVKAKPGQYVMVWWPGQNEKPFGVMKASPLTLSIAKVGPISEKIHELKIGDKMTFRGPYGQSFKIKGKKILMVAGGYGAVPLYFLALRFSAAKRKNIHVILGAKTRVEVPFVKKFEKLGCKVFSTTDDGSLGFPVFTTELTEVLLRKKGIDSVYACGPETMMKKVAAVCHKKKVFCQVSLERLFKCGGIGLCGECHCRGKLVCKDGPVFNGRILLD
jgi:dihydroorotate dehydrogenase electron transfer subunit